jgi:hypothetical protein
MRFLEGYAGKLSGPRRPCQRTAPWSRQTRMRMTAPMPEVQIVDASRS